MPKRDDRIDLACVEVVELVSDYLDRALTAHQLQLIEQHLLICPDCTAYVSQVRTAISIARGLADGDPDPASAGSAAEQGPAPDVEPLLALFRDLKASPGGEEP